MRKFFIAAAVAVVSLVASGPSAQAAIELRIYEGAYTVANTATSQTVSLPLSTGPVTFSGTVGDFVIVGGFGFSTSPGSPVNALTQEANVLITNKNGATRTLHIDISAQDFTSPNSPPPVDVEDTVSGSLVSGSVSGTFVGSADAGNTLFGAGFSPATLALTFSASGSSKSFAADGAAHGFLPSGSPYSLTSMATYTVSGASSLTLTGGNIQTSPTPAPAGLILALSGLPVLGLGWVRRRRQVA